VASRTAITRSLKKQGEASKEVSEDGVVLMGTTPPSLALGRPS